jgi:predicted PurR-regulated permease PerM
VLVWFVFQTHSIWVSFFLSYIITSALLPFGDWLRKHHSPKILATVIPYLTALIIIVSLATFIVNSFVPEIEKFIANFPALLGESSKILGLPIDGKTLQPYLSSGASSVSQNALNVTTSVFGGVFSIITILIVSFYLLLYHEAFHSWIADLFDTKLQKEIKNMLEQVDEKLGAWARGQLLLSVCIGTSIAIALSLLGIPYAIPLGILAGLLEFIPTLGPTIAAIPSVIVALTISTSAAITVVILFICIQFLESHILVPNIMQKAVGLNPVLVILGIGIGANLLGIPGALLAVPFISFLAVLINGIRTVDRPRP